MNSQELRALQEAYSQVYGLDEGRNTSLQALSRESEQRKADKKRGRPEAEVERDSRLMMGRFRPGASQGERAEGGREVLKARGKVPKKGGKDMFEHILEHLVAEGYADTNEAAIAIMANMSEDWRESIVGEFEQLDEITRSMGRRANEYNKKKEQDAYMKRVNDHQEKMKNDPDYRQSHMDALKPRSKK